jgi:hypothetical protein
VIWARLIHQNQITASGKNQLNSYLVAVRLKYFLEKLDIAPKVKEGCVKVRTILLNQPRRNKFQSPIPSRHSFGMS